MIQVGDTISDIVLDAYADGEIKKIKLGEYRGKWMVLLFYPADFTFVCPTELAEAAQSHELFKKEGAEIMSISTDTAFVHKAWHDKSESISQIKYPMLADPTGEVCRAFGTYIADEGLSRRATYIIDPDGKVVAFEIHDNSIGRNIKETLRKMQAAKFVREHRGKVCPASWMPGLETLTPGVDLIGKI
jgi:NADH-dependent peroxiredoxin subunit C